MTKIQIPELLVAQEFCEIAAGACIFRCHHLGISGDAFSTRRRPVGRFTPLISSEGEIVPTLYAAENFDAAVYETVLRQERSPEAIVQHSVVNSFGVSQISVCRELLMVELYTPELRRWSIDESKLFFPRKSNLSACRALAAGIWRDNPRANGIVWCSRQDSASDAYLIFGDRCRDGDLLVQQVYSRESDIEYSRRMVKVAKRAGIKIV